MKASTEDALNDLQNAWQSEAAFVRAHTKAQREETTLKERVADGIALMKLSTNEVTAASGDRLKLWLSGQQELDLGRFQGKPGAPVKLWVGSPDDPKTSIQGTLGPVRRHKLCLYLDSEDLPSWIESPGYNLELDAPDHLFEQGMKILGRWRNVDKEHHHLRDVFFSGDDLLPLQRSQNPEPLDKNLHPIQWQAVEYALRCEDVALIHGPPGTGKTRTLVEVIRQLVGQHQRVLVTAASNLAVDNLTERLIPHIPRVVRLGHPARILDQVQAASLDTQVEASPQYKLAKSWIDQANALRRQLDNQKARGRSGLNWREVRQQIRGLWRDAKDQLKAIQHSVLDRAQVVCATGSGTQHRTLFGQQFDVVVVDEATQITDPVVLGAILKGSRVVFAGDPHQLSPTVLGDSGGRLSSTLFERLVRQHPERVVMLVEQHRMHQDLMAFPSERTYDNALVAHPLVATQTLQDLGVKEDPLRPTPLVLVDTAGKGWDEEKIEGGTSLANPQQAARTEREVRRLVSRGIDPAEVGVISPYAGQVHALGVSMVDLVERGLEVLTVDGCQGREKEAVVLDLVRSNGQGEIGFLKDLRRINVALTRAKRQLLVVMDSATLGDFSYYEAFLKAVNTHGTWVSAWSDEAPLLDD